MHHQFTQKSSGNIENVLIRLIAFWMSSINTIHHLKTFNLNCYFRRIFGEREREKAASPIACEVRRCKTNKLAFLIKTLNISLSLPCFPWSLCWIVLRYDKGERVQMCHFLSCFSTYMLASCLCQCQYRNLSVLFQNENQEGMKKCQLIQYPQWVFMSLFLLLLLLPLIKLCISTKML